MEALLHMLESNVDPVPAVLPSRGGAQPRAPGLCFADLLSAYVGWTTAAQAEAPSEEESAQESVSEAAATEETAGDDADTGDDTAIQAVWMIAMADGFGLVQAGGQTQETVSDVAVSPAPSVASGALVEAQGALAEAQDFDVLSAATRSAPVPSNCTGVEANTSAGMPIDGEAATGSVATAVLPTTGPTAGESAQASFPAEDLAADGLFESRQPLATTCSKATAVAYVDADGPSDNTEATSPAEHNAARAVFSLRSAETEPPVSDAGVAAVAPFQGLGTGPAQAGPGLEMRIERAATPPDETAETVSEVLKPVSKTFVEPHGMRPETAATAEPLAETQAPPLAKAESASSSQDIPVLKTVGVQAVKNIRYLMSEGGKTLSVRLVPESLGEMHIEVHSSGDNLVVRLVSANAAVRQTLEAQTDHLRDALGRQGIDVGKVEIASTMSQSAGSGGYPGAGTASQTAAPRADSSARGAQSKVEQKPGPQNIRAARHDGTLNVFV